MERLEIPGEPAELTPEWLTRALREHGALAGDAAVTSYQTEPLGEGSGFIGLLLRLRPWYSGDAGKVPPTLIAKFPSPAPGARAIGKLYGAYEREVRFYSEIAQDIGLRAPQCYFSGMDADADRYFLLLEDLATAGRIGDQVAGCSEAEAMMVVGELAGFHAAWWNSPRLDEIAWLPRGPDLVRVSMQGLYPQVQGKFMELFGDRLTAEIAGTMDTLGERVVAMLPELEAGPQTIVHADFRLDNMFFGNPEAPYELAVIDWQAPNRSNGAYDLAYFVSGSMPPERRRACEMALIRRFHERLVEGGVRDYPLSSLLEDYRRSLVIALAIMAVSGSTLEITNERALQLFGGIFDGLVASIVDSKALELLPAPARR